MATEQYDSFEFLKPADFVPEMERVNREINEGYESAEQMARVNDQQRLQNAKIFGNAIKQAEKFIPTLAKYWKQEEERKDQLYRTEGLLLARESGATWSDLRDWAQRNKDKENYNADVGYYEHLAAKLEATGNIEDRDTARELRNLTGHRGVIFKEVLVGQAARSFSSDFTTSDFQTVDYKKEDGTPLAYSNVESKEELRILLREYHKHVGLLDIDEAGLSNDFLAERYWPQIQKQEEALIQTWSTNKYNADQVERKDLVIKRLGAAKGSNDIGEIYLQSVRNNPTLYKAGSKKGVLEEAYTLYENGELDREDLERIKNHLFIPKGYKDGKTPITIGKHFKPQFDDFDKRIAELDAKRFQNKQVERQNQAYELAEGLRQQVQERGFPLTEAEYATARNRLIQLGIYDLPKAFTILGDNTLQDQDDQALIDSFNHDASLGIPISEQRIMQIQDDTKRKAWLDNSHAINGISNIKTYHGQIDGFTNDLALRTTGDQTKSSEWYVMNYKLKNYFNQRYQHHIAVAPPTAEGRRLAAEKAITETQTYAKFNESNNEFGRWEPSDKITTYSANVLKATNALSKAKSTGNGIRYIENTIIPGTETALKELETWSPSQPLPAIYTEIASNFKTSADGLPATRWMIANAQYKLATGKELPKDKNQINLESLATTNQYIINYRRTNQVVRQVQIKEENKNDDKVWNKPAYTIFGPEAYSAPY